MKLSEFLARLAIVIILLGVGAIPFVFESRSSLIHARMPENGGWSTDLIQARVGEPLHLRFTSDDVVHGFAVGKMDMQPVDIEPGKVSETTLLFDKPGIYTFFCTRWCGINHWRMRGTIEVSGGADDPVSEIKPPLYVQLGLNLDSPRMAMAIPAEKPSARRGMEMLSRWVIDQSPDLYRSRSPEQMFQDLKDYGLTESESWDTVAAIWLQNTTPEALMAGQQIYAQDCAACHGETGEGDGVFARELAASGAASMQSMSGMLDMSMQAPPSLTNPARLLSASPALLHGKILRGGMGTGMPMWGNILTDEQIWSVVAYLYSFQFDYSK
jgi:mono/diheme cytochrome c family protein/plastocyanin